MGRVEHKEPRDACAVRSEVGVLLLLARHELHAVWPQIVELCLGSLRGQRQERLRVRRQAGEAETGNGVSVVGEDARELGPGTLGLSACQEARGRRKGVDAHGTRGPRKGAHFVVDEGRPHIHADERAQGVTSDRQLRDRRP